MYFFIGQKYYLILWWHMNLKGMSYHIEEACLLRGECFER